MVHRFSVGIIFYKGGRFPRSARKGGVSEANADDALTVRSTG